MNENIDFDPEKITDEEFDEIIRDLLLESARAARTASDGEIISIADPSRVNRVLCTYKILKYLTKGTKAEVSYVLHEPFHSTGSVQVVGKELLFRKPAWFMKAVTLANNFDVYPRTDGTVQLDFTFHGLTKPIK